MKTSADCMRDAFAAILRGDSGERDRLCAAAQRALSVEKLAAEASAVGCIVAIDFYVTADTVVIPTQRMARAAGVL